MNPDSGIGGTKAEIHEQWNHAIRNDITMVAFWTAAKSLDLDEADTARFVALHLLRLIHSARKRAAPETPAAEDRTRFDRLRETYERLQHQTDPHAILGTQPGDDRFKIMAAFQTRFIRHHSDAETLSNPQWVIEMARAVQRKYILAQQELLARAEAKKKT
jgi:hypothetical protein